MANDSKFVKSPLKAGPSYYEQSNDKSSYIQSANRRYTPLRQEAQTSSTPSLSGITVEETKLAQQMMQEPTMPNRVGKVNCVMSQQFPNNVLKQGDMNTV